MWLVNILTLFPNLFPGPLGESILGRALEKKKWEINVRSISDYALNKHKNVDAPPYGGGGGMVIRPDVLGDAIEDFFCSNDNLIVYMSPRGKVFNQRIAQDFAKLSGLNIICGKFEGIDERVLKEYRICEVSIGDFVLSSGDVAALAVIEACVRLIPGVLGNCASLSEESFVYSGGLLEYSHYTKPAQWRGRCVPEVLRSGNHAAISSWRLEDAKSRTERVRPELWQKYLKENE